ncbi:MAG: hypothetical protein HQK96_16015, partial [Nitrospirae bacterium]|nr:hypothetical protein [Nitrospirota bacterium]
RYGLTVDDVQDVIQSAVGGMNLTTTVEGRQRFPVNLRYLRDLRGNIDDLKRVLVPLMPGSSRGASSSSPSSPSMPSIAPIAQVPMGGLP